MADTTVQAAVDSMTLLNAIASACALAAGARAATDVTGFGRLRHLHRMLRASGLAATVYADECHGVAEFVNAGQVSGGRARTCLV